MSRIFKGMNCAGTIQNPDALFICAKAKRQQQLRQGEIDLIKYLYRFELFLVAWSRKRAVRFFVSLNNSPN